MRSNFTYLFYYQNKEFQRIYIWHLPILFNLFTSIIRIQQLKMNKQYSSKEYPKIFNLQGKQINSFEITIQGKLKQINSKDFFQLTQIVNLKNSSQLKAQSFYSIISNSNSITILHIFIYYCIKVTQNLQIEGIDCHYLKILANLYIESGFNIQINRYAHLISKTTSIALRKCIHILYYLLYGRLASNSYVNSIISQLAPKSQIKRQRLKMILSSKVINKKQPTLSQSQMKEDQKNTQCDELVKDLRQIFSKEVKEKDQKTKFRQWLISEQKQNQDQQNGWRNDKGLKNFNYSNKKSERKYYLNFFPNRVFNDEKSAVLEQIVPNLKSNYKLMRKRKFDDSKIQKMLYMTFNNGFNQEKKMQKKQNQVSLGKQRSKIFTHNIIKMNEKFKSTSSELDKIRYLITQNRKKRTSNPPPEKKEPLSLIQKEYFELIENKEFKQEKQQKTQPQTFSIIPYQAENTLVNLLRKEQKKSNSSQKDSEMLASKQIENPKLFNSCRSALQSKGVNKIVHSLCQNRVHKYKNQYRKFMKLHLFHQNDENR